MPAQHFVAHFPMRLDREPILPCTVAESGCAGARIRTSAGSPAGFNRRTSSTSLAGARPGLLITLATDDFRDWVLPGAPIRTSRSRVAAGIHRRVTLRVYHRGAYSGGRTTHGYIPANHQRRRSRVTTFLANGDALIIAPGVTRFSENSIVVFGAGGNAVNVLANAALIGPEDVIFLSGDGRHRVSIGLGASVASTGSDAVFLAGEL